MLTRTENVMTTILSQDGLKNSSSSIAELIWYSSLEPIHDQCILVMIDVICTDKFSKLQSSVLVSSYKRRLQLQLTHDYFSGASAKLCIET